MGGPSPPSGLYLTGASALCITQMSDPDSEQNEQVTGHKYGTMSTYLARGAWGRPSVGEAPYSICKEAKTRDTYSERRGDKGTSPTADLPERTAVSNRLYYKAGNGPLSRRTAAELISSTA